MLSLSEASLAEMRALIFKLRPEALESEGLISELDKQTAALRAWHEIDVRTSLSEEPALPSETKEALYASPRRPCKIRSNTPEPPTWASASGTPTEA